MGKPFDAELRNLADTYSWALEKDVNSLVDVLACPTGA